MIKLSELLSIQSQITSLKLTHLFLRESPRRARLLREQHSQTDKPTISSEKFEKHITLILRVFRGRQIAFLLRISVLDHVPLEEIPNCRTESLLPAMAGRPVVKANTQHKEGNWCLLLWSRAVTAINKSYFTDCEPRRV